MNFIQGLVKAPLCFEVTLKPVGMSRKINRIVPECVYLLTAADRDAAAQTARSIAEAEGFNNYAVTNIKERKQ
jgi:hypothetical protein